MGKIECHSSGDFCSDLTSLNWPTHTKALNFAFVNYESVTDSQQLYYPPLRLLNFKKKLSIFLSTLSAMLD